MRKSMNRSKFAAIGAGCVMLASAIGQAFAEAPVTNASEWTQAGDFQMMVRKPVQFDRTGERLDELLLKMPKRPASAAPRPSREIPNKFNTDLAPRPQAAVPADYVDAMVSAPTALAPVGNVSVPGPSSDDNAAVVGGRIAPPDITGDVGREFVVAYANLVWTYYDKSGAVVGGPFPGNSFWAGFGGRCESDNSGDPIAIYDHLADRWVFSQFAVDQAPFLQCFAISETNDPAGPYTRYAYEIVPGDFNDYPKIGLWSDGAGQSAYHATFRQFANGQSFSGIDAVAFDRDAMLAGDPAASFVVFRINTNAVPDGIQPAHIDGGPVAPAGSCGLYGAALNNNNNDGYLFWELCTDWNNPANSTFDAKPLLTQGVPPWAASGTVPQPAPGSSLDDLDNFTAYRFSTRFFPGQGMRGVMAHTINAGNNTAGMRWATFDLDNPDAITLDDTGTLGQGDGVHRWMGSATFDQIGNIGIAYSASATNLFPSVRFTGRETTDPAGTLQLEGTCVDGTGVQTGVSRWGDYSTTAVDPVDQCTFWTFQEYVELTGNFQWSTRVCSFSFPSCTGDEPPPPPPGNQPPVADAGGDVTVAARSRGIFDGTGSFDPDGNIVSYSWTTNSGALRLTNTTSASVDYSVRRVRTTTTALVTLTVTDNNGATASDTITVTITP
ncbi:PKD domain-containing protein [Sessilibacter sp. MAH4]